MKEPIVNSLVKVTNLSKEEIEKLIEVPKNPTLGDFAFPCFILAKSMKKSPIQIAEELSKSIEKKDFEKVQAAGPYLNFFLKKENLAEEVITKILKEKDKYGSSNIGKGKTIMIEFSQANTHKAFHVGHIRGTSIGESLSRIFEFLRHKIIRANYQGDTGMHVAKWIWCYKKYHPKEKLKKDESWTASIYVDAIKKLDANPDLQEEVNAINKQLEEGKDRSLIELWKNTRKLCLDALETIYKELNTHFDRFYFEREVELEGEKIAQNLVKQGIAKISDGAAIIDLTKYGLSIWVLLRKDGTVLYSSKDIALAKKKFQEFKIDKSINVVADEQNLHFQQLFKTLELMKFENYKKCQHLPFALVRLPTGKMSSRTGDNILYSDFMKEITSFAKSEIEKRESLKKTELEKRALAVSIAAVKYSMLKQHANNVIVFSKEEAMSFEGNTGPYLLYTFARANSILAKKKPSKLLIPNNLAEIEKQLILKLNEFPSIVQKAYEQLAPNLIANYAYHIAQQFNEFYHSCQVIGAEQEAFRLSIVEAFSIVLENALNLLGINVLKRM